MVRATASISALLKFRVTASPGFDAALACASRVYRK